MLKKERNNNKFQERGITLLALVITIIVLLILAGVTLNGIFGESGIINNAEKAKENTEIANEKELVEEATIVVASQSRTGEITVNEMQQAINEKARRRKSYSNRQW